MAHTCSECTYLDIDTDDSNGKFWCESKCERVYANQLECNRYCTAYSRPSSVSASAKVYSEDRQNNSGGCYITTALCDILSKPDNNSHLNVLRDFRKNYLQKSEIGLEILIQYDIVGPEISKHLRQDGGKFNIANYLFREYIDSIVVSIVEGKYGDAINKYMEMTNKLMKYYDIEFNTVINVDEYDAKASGHGYVVKKMSLN